jgi:hypothetical protein
MNRGRLSLLAAYLETIPEDHFDMSEWVRLKGASVIEGAVPEPKCGTSACALGWACSIPEFNDVGLKLDRVVGAICDAVPTYEHARGYDAAEKFFELTHQQARYIFRGDTNKATPKDVCNHIYNLILHPNIGGYIS